MLRKISTYSYYKYDSNQNKEQNPRENKYSEAERNNDRCT